MLKFRFANISDLDLYYKWATDAQVRKNSFSQEPIPYENHVTWFRKSLMNPDKYFYLFFSEGNQEAGQVRIEKSGKESLIGISIDSVFRGKGLAKEMIALATADHISKFPENTIVAYIRFENSASLKAFISAGYTNEVETEYAGIPCYSLTYKEKNA